MHANACLISILQLILFQGFAVTLPYCFLNTEIKNVVKSRWARFQVYVVRVQDVAGILCGRSTLKCAALAVAPLWAGHPLSFNAGRGHSLVTSSQSVAESGPKVAFMYDTSSTNPCLRIRPNFMKIVRESQQNIRISEDTQ